MRRLKTLLELLLQQVIKSDKITFYGMCGEIDVMHGDYCKMYTAYYRISLEEKQRLKAYLKLYQPKGIWIGDYWWKSGKKEPRIDWLIKHIKLLTK